MFCSPSYFICNEITLFFSQKVCQDKRDCKVGEQIDGECGGYPNGRAWSGAPRECLLQEVALPSGCNALPQRLGNCNCSLRLHSRRVLPLLTEAPYFASLFAFQSESPTADSAMCSQSSADHVSLIVDQSLRCTWVQLTSPGPYPFAPPSYQPPALTAFAGRQTTQRPRFPGSFRSSL